jgi:hypothetical protein
MLRGAACFCAVDAIGAIAASIAAVRATSRAHGIGIR